MFLGPLNLQTFFYSSLMDTLFGTLSIKEQLTVKDPQKKVKMLPDDYPTCIIAHVVGVGVEHKLTFLNDLLKDNFRLIKILLLWTKLFR